MVTYTNTTSTCSLHNKSSNLPLIWVYNLTDLSLMEKAPFEFKVECASLLKISRNTVTTHLNTNISYKNKWIFSFKDLTVQELSQFVVPLKVWQILTGELLGDAYIRYDPLKAPQINGRLEFTFSSKILYVRYLKYHALSFISTNSEPTPWPNPMKGQDIKQYWFSSKRLASISLLHSIWYKEINGKYIKILPINIEKLLTPLGLAHWIMGDGYFDQTVRICTDNFTKEEVDMLIKV